MFTIYNDTILLQNMHIYLHNNTRYNNISSNNVT